MMSAGMRSPSTATLRQEIAHEQQGAASDRRRRVILTRGIDAIAPHATIPNALLWNPAGALFPDVCKVLNVSEGLIVASGAADVFALFLRLGFDAFHLSREPRSACPAGDPSFQGCRNKLPNAFCSNTV